MSGRPPRHHSSDARRRPHSKPYSRPPTHTPRHHHHQKNTIHTISDALLTDTLLTKDDFLRIAKPTDSDLDAAYIEYAKEHQRSFLIRFYKLHGQDPWLKALYQPASMYSSDGNIKNRVEWFVEKCLRRKEEVVLESSSHIELISESRVTSGTGQSDGVRMLQTSKQMPSALTVPTLHDISNSESEGKLRQLYINNIPPNASSTDLLSLIKETVPTAVSLVLSNPVPSRGFCRSGWLSVVDSTMGDYSCPEVRILDGLSFASSTLSFYPKDPHRRIKLVSGKFGEPERVKRDLLISRELITSMNVSRGIAFDMSEFESISEERLRLDLQIMFLRIVHWVCYYSAYEAACAEELTRHCGDIVLRDHQIDADDLTVFDKKIQLLIDRGHYNLGLQLVSLNQRLTEKYCEQLEPERWRCKSCSKLFKGADFLLKHLSTKHEDLVQTETNDLDFLNSILRLPHFLLLPNSMIIKPAGPLRRYTRPPSFAARRDRDHTHKHHGQSSHKHYVDLDAVRPSDSIDISYDL